MGQTATGRRLERAARGAQALAESRAEEASRERRRVIASWNLHGRVPEHLANTSEAGVDEQLVVLAQEHLYQYEREHGPVRPLRPTPDLTAEEWAARTDEEVAGYSKGLLQTGLTPEWKRPRAWLGKTKNGPGGDTG